MASVALVHPEGTLTVPALHAMTKCTLFQKNAALADAPYRLSSSVPLTVFRQFVSAIEGNSIEITSANFSGLFELCEEFGFEELRSKLSQSTLPHAPKVEDSEARARIAALEEWARLRDRDIAGFHRTFARLNADIGRLAVDVSQVRPGRAVEKLSAEVTRLRSAVSALQTKMRSEVSALKAKVSAMPATAPAHSPAPPAVRPSPSLGSAIVSDFPEIFAEFRGQSFSLLWRGSRVGFGPSEFHGRCDGHANTLTVILDTKGNIFGGFTPVEWESPEKSKYSRYKADDSQKSFVFTLKNPHNIPARKFALKAEKKQLAIWCISGFGPRFGLDDIYVSDNCNTNTRSCTSLGRVYTNDTGLHGEVVFTGSRDFQVKEIEVFEITD
jgi:hypothetical protein